MKSKDKQCIRVKFKKIESSTCKRQKIEDEIANFLEQEDKDNELINNSNPDSQINIYLSQKHDPLLNKKLKNEEENSATPYFTQKVEFLSSPIYTEPQTSCMSQQNLHDFESLLSMERFKRKQEEYECKEDDQQGKEEELDELLKAIVIFSNDKD